METHDLFNLSNIYEMFIHFSSINSTSNFTFFNQFFFRMLNSTLESPIYGLDDVYNNKVVTICFRDPKYADGFIFEAKKLPGAIDPPNVLAPENRPSNYRPQIGFNRNFPQASLGDAGHRMVNHYSGGYKQQQQQQYNNDNRNFASIAPPNSYNRHSEYHF